MSKSEAYQHGPVLTALVRLQCVFSAVRLSKRQPAGVTEGAGLAGGDFNMGFLTGAVRII
jgi:hypothetical protein